MMINKKIFFTALSLLFCLLLAPTSLAFSTSDAAEPLNTDAVCSLALEYRREDRVFSGIEIRLYRVATLTGDLSFELCDDFSATGLTVNGIKSNREWETVATTLESFVCSRSPAPYAVGRTLDGGKVEFGNLSVGLYFVMPLSISDGGAIYSFDSAIISVPSLNADRRWTYDMSAVPKSNVSYPSDEPSEPIYYSVTKLWQDDDVAKRPTNAVIDIIRNDEVINTVSLSSLNNWTYSWQSDNALDSWQVAERVIPDGYTVKIEKHGTAFTVINSSVGHFSDTPDTPPPTGDTANIGAYLLLLSFSGILLAALGLIRKNKA